MHGGNWHWHRYYVRISVVELLPLVRVCMYRTCVLAAFEAGQSM